MGKNRRYLDGASEVRDRTARYFADHPRSPSPVRQPQVSQRDGTFIVLLGRNMKSGIVGLGNTVENALRAFDVQCLRTLRPPEPRPALAPRIRQR